MKKKTSGENNESGKDNSNEEMVALDPFFVEAGATEQREVD